MLKRSPKGYYFWEEYANMDQLVHGISSRHFGSIKNNRKINEKNLKKFLDVLLVDRENVIFPRQVHGSNVLVLNDFQKGEIGDADGLITQRKNIFLGVVTADCLPVIFYEPKIGIVGIAHAGYKGLLKDILQEMIKNIKKIGANVKNIKIAIGPSIGACCYDVPYGRVQMFVGNVYQVGNGKYFLDLKNIAKQILMLEGIPEDNIEISDICTKDNIKDFFSFRGEGQKNFGEFATIVGMV